MIEALMKINQYFEDAKMEVWMKPKLEDMSVGDRVEYKIEEGIFDLDASEREWLEMRMVDCFGASLVDLDDELLMSRAVGMGVY